MHRVAIKYWVVVTWPDWTVCDEWDLLLYCPAVAHVWPRNSLVMNTDTVNTVTWFVVTCVWDKLLTPPRYYVFGGVLLFVCLHNNWKSYGRILIKFSGNVDHGARNRWFDCGCGTNNIKGDLGILLFLIPSVLLFTIDICWYFNL